MLDNCLVMRHQMHSCLIGLVVMFFTLSMAACGGTSGVSQAHMPFTSAEAALGQSATADPTIPNNTLLDGGITIAAPSTK